MNVEEQAAVLEGIAFGADPRITPGDRMEALRRLAELPGKGQPGSAAMLELAGEVALLSDEALDKELAGFVDGGYEPPPPPDPGSKEAIDQEVESRFRRAVRGWAKARGVRLEPVRSEPDGVAAQTSPEPVSEPRAPVEDEVAKRRSQVHRLDTGEVIDLAAPMTEAQRSIAQSKMARQQVRDQIREEKRRAHPFARHMPPGTDPEAWDRSFR